jgi:hypothetical protein
MVKSILRDNWTVWRIVKLVLSMMFLVGAVHQFDYILGAGAIYLFINSIFNTCKICHVN